MPDLEIHEGDLEKLSTELRAISEKVGRYIPLPPNLAQVQSAMDGGDAPPTRTTTRGNTWRTSSRR